MLLKFSTTKKHNFHKNPITIPTFEIIKYFAVDKHLKIRWFFANKFGAVRFGHSIAILHLSLARGKKTSSISTIKKNQASNKKNNTFSLHLINTAIASTCEENSGKYW